ncbi:methyltransferase [Clostridium sp. CAG:628]|nr:methyltransferase [Clostridium sp. CAG:628]
MNVENVINDLVGYDNLKIVQNSNYFNFSLESVMIPRFCVLKNNMKIIDFCTGNAPIPMILSTLTDSNIIGVELQKEIYNLAVQSIKINNLEDRITLLNMNVLDIFNVYETDSFDLITCNPPYFRVNEFSNLNNNMIKSIARHEIEIKLEDICRISKKLLKNNGSLVLVHRTDRLSEIINMLLKYNLQPKRIRFLYSKEQENSNLVLIDARKNGNIGLKVLPPLICHNMDGSYTKEVLDMFRR